MTDDQLSEFIAAVKATGTLDVLIKLVPRFRRDPGFFLALLQDLEESERRHVGGCGTYKIHHDGKGMVGNARSLGVERDAKAERKAS